MATTEDIIARLKREGVPKGTRGGEEWAYNNYNNWATKHKQLQYEDLIELSKKDACPLLQRWFVECEGTNKSDLDADTRRVLFHSLARRLKKDAKWSLKSDDEFADLYLIGRALVREKRVDQRKTKAKKAAQLTTEEEDKVYFSRILLPVNGLALNHALFFLLSVGWGCRGGVLAHVNPLAVELVVRKDTRFLSYNMAVDKNHQGRLKDADIPPTS